MQQQKYLFVLHAHAAWCTSIDTEYRTNAHEQRGSSCLLKQTDSFCRSLEQFPSVHATDCQPDAFWKLSLPLSVPQPPQRSLTTSGAPWLFPSPRPAAYRQMHKEFNRVDLMRGWRRELGKPIDVMDLLHNPPQPIGQIGCIDRGHRGIVLVPWSYSWGLQLGQAGGELQLCDRDVSIF